MPGSESTPDLDQRVAELERKIDSLEAGISA